MCCCKVYWGWIVCLSFLLVFTVTAGVAFSFSEIMIPYNEEIHTSAVLLSWLASMPVSLPMLAAPLGNAMYERFGCQRTVLLGVFCLTIALSLTALVRNVLETFLTYGILASVGILFIIQPPFFLLDIYFPYNHPRHVLATSIIACGFPLATLIFNPLTYALIHAVGWRITFSIFAVVAFLVGVMTAMTFRAHENNLDEVVLLGPKEEDTKEMEKYHKGDEKAQITRRTEVILGTLWFAASTFKCMGYYTPFVTLVKQMDALGIPQRQSANAMAVVGACEVLSRAVTSYFGDHIKGRMLWMYVGCTLALCLQNTLGSLAKDFTGLAVYAAALGTFGGPIIAAMYSSCSEVLCGQKVPALFSVFRVGLGVGSLLGPVMAGAIFDLTESYHLVFYVNAVVYLCASLLYLAIIALNRTKPSWCFPRSAEHVTFANSAKTYTNHNTFLDETKEVNDLSPNSNSTIDSSSSAILTE